MCIRDRYKSLDIKQLKEQFERFPTLSIFDKEYPIELKHTYNPPVLLYYQGNLDLLIKPKLAVVGARNCSETGKQSVRKIVSELGNQFTIVSGLARGIDTCAHMESLKNKGNTIAVIGTGLDVYYPKENKALQEMCIRDSSYTVNQTTPKRFLRQSMKLVPQWLKLLKNVHKPHKGKLENN